MRLDQPAPTFDLQSHSQHSDGALAPADVVRAAHAAGVQLLALTDHDTVDGVPEAAAAAGRLAVALVTGVEISTLDRSGVDLHILGYLIDVRDAPLGERLLSFRADRERRALLMAQALRELGFELDDGALVRRTGGGSSIGRPHLAQAVMSHPANHARLAAEGLRDPSSFLEAYLAEDRPAFRPRQAPSVPEAIELIHAAGGIAVWGHPFWDLSEPSEVLATIDRFAALGLDGVEAFYVTHTREQTLLLAEHCRRRGLLSTGSSDFHGPQHRLFNRFRAFDTFGARPMLGPLTRQR
ncbi:MAG: PHP domain-containing protein [Solirubrobacteraceae bacterium]